MAVAGMGTPSRNWPRGILIGLPGSYSDSMNLDTVIRGVNALTISLQKPNERGPEQGQKCPRGADLGHGSIGSG